MRPNWKVALVSAGIFLATLFPQVLFDIRHDGLIRKGVAQNFAASTTPAFSFTKQAFISRWAEFTDIYAGELIQRDHDLLKILVVLVIPLLLIPAFRKNSLILLTLIGVPIVILSFYQGNFGNFYSYYMIGTFPIFMILLAGILSWYWRHPGLAILPMLFLALFVYKNGILVHNFLIAGVDGPENIVYGNQTQVIDWVYADAAGRPFNVDVYVPPVIPYAYDYLFDWRGKEKFKQTPAKEQVKLLYTVYEVDPPHPERLAAWLLRQSGIGEVKQEHKFGGIVVQRRDRFVIEKTPNN
jgi:hypothetical protein